MERIELFGEYQSLHHLHHHKRFRSLLPEFRRGLAEAIGTFAIVLVSCLGNASKHTSELGTRVRVRVRVLSRCPCRS
jgi:hypothetical protein